MSAYSIGSMPRGLALAAMVRSFPGPIAFAKRIEQQDVVVAHPPRLSGLQAAGNRMLPVDVDAVELRVGLQEIGARSRERLPGGLGGGHLVERSRIGPATHRHEELQWGCFCFSSLI